MHRSATKIILNRFFASSQRCPLPRAGRKCDTRRTVSPKTSSLGAPKRRRICSRYRWISFSFLFLPLLRLLRTTTSFSPLSKASFDLKSPTMMMSSSVFRRHHHRSPHRRFFSPRLDAEAAAAAAAAALLAVVGLEKERLLRRDEHAKPALASFRQHARILIVVLFGRSCRDCKVYEEEECVSFCVFFVRHFIY